jgi:hypothetical protein
MVASDMGVDALQDEPLAHADAPGATPR